MERAILSKAKSLAATVREHVEKWVEDNEGVYQDMEGACAIASYTLWKVYQAFEVESELAVNDGHCFLLLGDMVVDITATQFGKYPEVYLCSRKKQIWFHEIQLTGDEAVEDLKTWWPPQQPFQYELHITELIESLQKNLQAA